jgi:hypothetical protein
MKSDQGVLVTVSYGDGMPSAISFVVWPSHDIKDYLVRISSQWKWASEPINSITVSSAAPVEVQAVYVRKGD